MKKIISIITVALALSAVFAVGAFAVDGGSDTGALSAFGLILQGYIQILYANFKEIMDPLYQAIVWVFDQLWGLLNNLVSGLLS